MTQGHSFRLVSVPEPSSFVLAALGLIGLVAGRRKRPNEIGRALALFALLSICAAEARAVTIEWTTVGDPGNAGELSGNGAPGNPPGAGPSAIVGAVNYTYRIATTEVTASQYVEFLNIKDPTGANTLGLYDSNMNIPHTSVIFNAGNADGSKYSVGAGRENFPANSTSWYNAIRFANWVNNGQGNGDTETGAYTLLGGTPVPSNGAHITRNAGANVFLPSENEWYKAAYYNAGNNSYFAYPTSSNVEPIRSPPTSLSNHANIGLGNNFPSGPEPTDVGAYTGTTSPYGAFDMAGNVWEWNEAIVSTAQNGNFSFRGVRGGDFVVGPSASRSALRTAGNPSDYGLGTGFRLASVPEPSSLVLAALGFIGLVLCCRKRPSAGVAALTVLLSVVAAESDAVTIDTVPVDNPDNAPDTTGYGAVAYNYRIGTTEITVGQYTAFLNAVAATDTYSLYNTKMATDHTVGGISRSSAPGNYSYSAIGSPNKPVTYVNWGDAARFSNWLHNGQLTGAQDASTTENGSYALNGAVTGAALNAISRSANATWVIPTENEWYKAAYFQPAAAGGDADNYWSYPMRTNMGPNSDQPPGDPTIQSNVANFLRNDGVANGYNDGFAVTGSTSVDFNQNYLTDVGAYTHSGGFYGTFDQGGNAPEWTESVGFIPASFGRIVRGGDAGTFSSSLQSSSRFNIDYSLDAGTGFRVALVPEPSSFVLAALALIGLIHMKRRTR